MNKEDTILYLRHLKEEGYIFSNFNLKHVLDFIDELQEERTYLLKRLEKEKSIRKEAIEYIKNRCEFFADDEDGTVYYDNVLSDNDIYGILSILEKE